MSSLRKFQPDQQSDLPEELRSLFAEYRDAHSVPEPSEAFGAKLWSRIDARRAVPVRKGVWARLADFWNPAPVELPRELSTLMSDYREAQPVPEASPRFLPGLWARIEAKRSAGPLFGRMATRVVGVACAMCLLMAGVFLSNQNTSPVAYSPYYVDQLLDADDRQEPEASSSENI